MTPPHLLPIPHATCLACGCLCDDITVSGRRRARRRAERACPLGLPWFLAPHPGAGRPAATIEGQPVELDDALDRAAAILRQARAPVVWGLPDSAVEAVRAALALADRLGAAVDLAGSAGRAARRAAFVRVGAVSATLGEVKDRAEVVLFWGNHPDATHPRHAERYSVHPSGGSSPGRGRSSWSTSGPAPRSGRPTRRIDLDPRPGGARLAVLLALARGVALDPARVERATGHPLASGTT